MLNKLLLTLLFSLPAVAQEECIIPGPPFIEIENVLRGFRNDCQELAKGSYRIQRDVEGRTQHLMERDGNGNYRATFNIEWKPQRGVTTTPAEMQFLVNGCLDMASPYLRGPDGKSLTIRALTQDEVERLPRQQRPGKVVIEIGPLGSRSNSKMYSPDDDCATIVHEMLHNLGLQDEYPEESEELKNTVNCRPITVKDSVMYFHDLAFNLTVPRTITCSCSSSSCDTLKANPDPDLIRRLSQDARWPLEYQFQEKYCTYEYGFAPTGATPIEGLKLVSNNDDSFVAKYHSYIPSAISNRYKMMETIVTCRCTDDECRSGKTALIGKIGKSIPSITYCPSGMTETSRVFDKAMYRPGFVDGEFRFSTTPSRNTLLYPNQFKRAISGSCQNRIPGYDQCSEYAYKGSGLGNCGTPEVCSNANFYIGTIQQ